MEEADQFDRLLAETIASLREKHQGRASTGVGSMDQGMGDSGSGSGSGSGPNGSII